MDRVNSTVTRLLHDTSESCSTPECRPSTVDASINRWVGSPARARFVVIWAKIVAPIAHCRHRFARRARGAAFLPIRRQTGRIPARRRHGSRSVLLVFVVIRHAGCFPSLAKRLIGCGRAEGHRPHGRLPDRRSYQLDGQGNDHSYGRRPDTTQGEPNGARTSQSSASRLIDVQSRGDCDLAGAEPENGNTSMTKLAEALDGTGLGGSSAGFACPSRALQRCHRPRSPHFCGGTGPECPRHCRLGRADAGHAG